MKRTTVFTMCCLLLTFACMLTGCETDVLSPETSVQDVEAQENADIFGYSQPSSNRIQNENIYVITDPDTGVQYIVFREKAYNAGMGGITPRLNPDGSLCVVDVEDKE